MNPQGLGYLFTEQVRGDEHKAREEPRLGRTHALWALSTILFILLTARLFWLQIVSGSRNRTLSEENRILARLIQAPRGVIMDRHGNVLAENEPVYTEVDESCRGQRLFPDTRWDLFCSASRTISREEALEHQALGRGSEIATLVGRHYRLGREIAHTVGYVGEASAEDLAQHPDYDMGDLVGKGGVELVYEELLHGQNGAELVEVDAQSVVVREVAKKEPIPGEELTLTIDAQLQVRASALLEGKRGALVAVNPQNGEVLALVSSPSFDPNDVGRSLSSEDQPFFNRALAGLYPPGSVFKVVTAVAGLEEGTITASTEIEDTGEIRIGPYRYGNWYFNQYGRTEGVLTIVRAIKRSNDIFFYKVGESVGATRLSDWAKAFGYGRLSGIDLPGEQEGLVPSPEWKEQTQGERWFLGNTYHFAIGQSDLQVTPLQVTLMTAAAASGKLCQPHLRLDGEAGTVCRDLGTGEDTLWLVREGMMEACRNGGTAFPFFNFGVMEEGVRRRIEVGCKTGTAEFGDPQGRTHAWFTVFAPAEAPEIVVTVLLEGAGEGSYQAAPVAKDFLTYYFSEIEK